MGWDARYLENVTDLVDAKTIVVLSQAVPEREL